MKPISLRFILKSGKEFTVKCSDFRLDRNLMANSLVSCRVNGVIENNPVFLNLSEVAAVIRLVQDEQEGGDEE